MTGMQLTDEQVRFFEVFGFLVLRHAFDKAEMDTIIDGYSAVLADDRSGKDFEGDKRQEVDGFLEQCPALFWLVEDDRIFCALEQLLGPEFVWVGSDGNLYIGDTRWHPDNRDQYRRVKVAFYLDSVRRDSGCLRVIPGSHHPGYADALKERWPLEDPRESPYGVAGFEIPSQALESDPGDVVFFNQSLFHASYGGRSGRRMFTLNFGAQPRETTDYENLRRVYEANVAKTKGQADGSTRRYTPRDHIYSDAFLHSESPRIQRMVREVNAMGMR